MKDIYLFISSTFSDMQDERELLIREVFPQVHDYCRQRNLVFHPIDLRWGITEEQANELHRTINLCLQRVNEANPLFLSFLGQRYGWIPEDEYILPHLYDHPDAIRACKGKSATELEILQALHSMFYRGEPKKCLFFFKDPSYLDTISEAEKARYTDSPENIQKLEALKADLQEMGCEITEYTSEFVPTKLPYYIEDRGAPMSETLIQTNFCCKDQPLTAIITRKIIAAIDAMIPEAQNTPICYDGQRTQEFLLNYHAHTTPIASVDEFLEHEMEQPQGSLHVLQMPEMQGKSSALARFIVKLQEQNVMLFYRFLGTDTYSSSIQAVVKTLSQEMSARLNLPFDGEDDYFAAFDFVQNCLNQLHKAGVNTVLILDGVDHTTDPHLCWRELIHSVMIGHTFYSTTDLFDMANSLRLTRYTDDEMQAIIDFHFLQYGKSVDARYSQKLIEHSKGQPVHILHAIRYISRFSSFESLESDIDRFIHCSHLDGIVLLDDMYSRAQIQCTHWNRHYYQIANLLSMVTYPIMLCRKGISFDELYAIISTMINLQFKGMMKPMEIADCIHYELRLLQDEIKEIDGIYTIKDPFYADFLIAELSHNLANRRMYFELVVAVLASRCKNGMGCIRYFEIIDDLIENSDQEHMEAMLRGFYFQPEFLEQQMQICGYAYTLRRLRFYYIKTLNYQHLLKGSPTQVERAIQRFLAQTPTTVQNEIGLLYRLLALIPPHLQGDMETIYSCLHYQIQRRGLEDRLDDCIITPLWEKIKTYPPQNYGLSQGVLLPGGRCEFAPHQMLLFYNELFVCGKDDRVYVFNVETGERVDLIQLQQNDKPLCLFRLQGNIYIVSTNLIYILDMENQIKVPFDYSKYTASPVKGVDVYDDEDIAFWYEDGKIKWYRGMQPLMEIDDFLGEDIESVKIARTKSSMVALVTIREEGCVLWVNGRKLYDFGIDAEAIFRSGSFNHVDQKTLFIAISPHHYYTIDLNTFQMETHQTDYPLHGSLFAIDSNIITESEDGRMVINGHRLEHAAPVQYAGRLGRNTYYFVDAEGKLFSL